MKVKIIASSLPTYWYADRVGEVFDVIEGNPTKKEKHVVVGFALGDMPVRFIEPDDCMVIEEIQPGLTS